ncbi:MAG: hypothetical protein JRM77_10015 [Nitrososphaerota archaeon]|nr:hypothetical protein [Nitrososphaerota archaeon]
MNDANVSLWLEEVGRNSKQTAMRTRNGLGLFLDWAKLTPTQLREMEKRPRDDLITRFIRDREARGLLQESNFSILKYIRGYLGFNDIAVRKIPLKKTGTNSENEKVPLREEVADILYHRKAPPRAVAEIALMAFSGLRPESLGNYEGTDGIRIGDIPDMKIEGASVTFTKTPARVNVRWNISKNRKKFFTFLPEEGCTILKEHLEYVASLGEPLTPNLPVILASYRLQHRGQYRDRDPHPLATQDIGNEIRRVLRPKYLFRPYLFRAYFDTALELAESRRAITHSQRAFWMGHTGDIEAVYSTRKELRPEMVEEMRRCFTEAAKFIQTKGEGAIELAKEEFDERTRATDQAVKELQLQYLSLESLHRRTLDEIKALKDRIDERLGGSS